MKFTLGYYHIDRLKREEFKVECNRVSLKVSYKRGHYSICSQRRETYRNNLVVVVSLLLLIVTIGSKG